MGCQDYKVICRDCGDELGSYYADEAVWIAAEIERIAALRDSYYEAGGPWVELTLSGESVGIDWCRDHRHHTIVVPQPYGEGNLFVRPAPSAPSTPAG